MNSEIFAALKQLEKERGIPTDYMVEKITQALVAAYKKDRDGYTDNVFVTLDEDALHMYAQKEVVDDVISPSASDLRGASPPPEAGRSVRRWSRRPLPPGPASSGAHARRPGG